MKHWRLHHEIDPAQKNNAWDTSFSFLSWKKTRLTHREKFVWLVQNPPDWTRIHSLWEKILRVLQNNRRGPLPSFISTNYNAVLQKGFETTFQAKWVVLNWGHACWEFLLVGNKYYIRWWARDGEGYSAGRYWVPNQTCTTLNTLFSNFVETPPS
jgi:hypothetical protein